ncbi:hypothetical protein ElyMa_005043200 [Elysia marginata]|uniref:Uncharacterized protein n=1 Tax=Elysia marginata TaxID=1093978 RepID=A0AAV4JC77_9GAST|nr:hypothetical protein ElyMa_005043200 [Elysia marginata]
MYDEIIQSGSGRYYKEESLTPTTVRGRTPAGDLSIDGLSGSVPAKQDLLVGQDNRNKRSSLLGSHAKWIEGSFLAKWTWSNKSIFDRGRSASFALVLQYLLFSEVSLLKPA